jgi:hypothetical protein
MGYASFATRGIYATASQNMEAAHRMATYAGRFSLAQLLLGVLSVGLGWSVKATSRDSVLAGRLGVWAVYLGVAVLVLMLVLV